MKHFLWYDENGEKLNVGDVVLVNSEFSTVIDQDQQGNRFLKCIPDDLLIEAIKKIKD